MRRNPITFERPHGSTLGDFSLFQQCKAIEFLAAQEAITTNRGARRIGVVEFSELRTALEDGNCAATGCPDTEFSKANDALDFAIFTTVQNDSEIEV